VLCIVKNKKKMSLQIAYFFEKEVNISDLNGIRSSERINIIDYDKEKHKGKVYCPLGHKLIGKQGEKVVWHYAHMREYNDDCCRHMGEWHNLWQGRVYDDFLEIVTIKTGLNEKKVPRRKIHIADMVNADDIVIEFQKSTIPEKVITQREKFYQNMIWVFGCEQHDMKIVNTESRFILMEITGGSLYFTIAKKQSFLDFGRRHLLEVIEIDKKRKTQIKIYCKIWTLVEFDKKFMSDCLREDCDQRKFHAGYEFEDDGRGFQDCKKFL